MTKTKAELQQELLQLMEENKRLKQELHDRVIVPITSNNTSVGAPAPKQNRNTDGVHNSDERVRESLHKPDQPDPDTVAPSYNQLYKICDLLATFNYHPGPQYNASSRQHADEFIKAFNKHISSIPKNGDKPYRVYTIQDPQDPTKTIRLYGDEWKSAKNLAAAEMLAKALIKYHVTKPE